MQLSKQAGASWKQYITKYDMVPVFESQTSYNQKVELQINKVHDFIAAMLLELRSLLAILDTQKDIKETLKQEKINFDAIDTIMMRMPTTYVDIYSE